MASERSVADNVDIQQALSELEERLSGGEPFPCERVFEKYPSLSADAESFLELLYTEHLLREERNAAITPADWIKRFPERTRDIENLFRMQNCLSGEGNRRKRVIAEGSDRFSGSEVDPDAAQSDNSNRLGDYEILEQIGQGGMGTVYRARQIGLDRVVCLKVSNQRWVAADSSQRQLRNEAEISSRLLHPSIVQIYEAGVDDEIPYFSMEYVDGPSLAEVLQTGPLAFDSAARLVERLARAVSYAHSMGVIHRDLKPANILLAASQKGEAVELTVSRGPALQVLQVVPKITDFGLAKRDDPDRGATLPGTAIGTPSYMAPEQTGLTNGTTTFASDLYALGAVLYDCIAGRPPFRAATTLDTLLQVRSKEPVPLRTLQPGVPPDLETICLKCLNKSPEKRYASAAALAEDLRRFLEGRPIQARPVPAWEHALKWGRRHPTLAALILSLIVGTLGICWQWIRAEYLREQALANATAATKAELAAIRESRRLEHTLYDNNVSLAQREFEASNVMRAISLLDACPESLRDWEWRFLKDVCQRGVRDFPSVGMTVRDVAFNPVRPQIAVAASIFGRKTVGPVRLFDLETNRATPLEGLKYPVMCVEFSPDGKLVGTLGRANESPNEFGGMTIWDAATGKPISHFDKVDGYTCRFSPDGSMIAVGEVFGLSLWSIDGRLIHQLASRSGSFFDLAWSPDGSRLLAGAKGNVRIWDVMTGKAIHTLSASDDVRRVTWSSTGTDIAYGTFAGLIKVFRLSPNELAPYERLRVSEDGIVAGLRFSPDGAYLAISHVNGRTQLIDAASGMPIRVFPGHNGAVLDLEFGMDGAAIVTGGADGRARVWDLTIRQEPSRSFPGGPYMIDMQQVPGGDEIILALGENKSVFTRYENKTVRIWNCVERKVVAEFGKALDWQTAVAAHPDGQTFASGGADGTVHLWNRQSPHAIHEFSCNAAILRVRFFHQGRRLAALTTAGRLFVWDVELGTELRNEHVADEPTACSAGVDSSRLALAGRQGIVIVDLVADSKRVALDLETKFVQLAMSADGTRLAGATEDFRILIWNLNSALSPAPRPPDVILKGHTEPAVSLDFSADGSRLCSASFDRTVKLWDVEYGQIVLNLRVDMVGNLVVAFVPSRDRIIAASTTIIEQWNARATRGTGDDGLFFDHDSQRIWHRQELTRASQMKCANAVQFHASKLLLRVGETEGVPENQSAGLLRQRGIALGQLGRWDEAISDLQAISNPTVGDLFTCVVLNKRNRNESACREQILKLVSRAGSANRAETNSILWCCVFLETGLPDQLEPLLGRLIGERNDANFASTIAAIKYRQGKLFEALDWIENCHGLRSGKMYPPESYLYALILVRLGKVEAAQTIVNQTRTWVESQRRLVWRREPTDNMYSWIFDLEAQFFLDEYQQFVAEQK